MAGSPTGDRGRSSVPSRALRYERALVYDAMGRENRARGEFQNLYAHGSEYEDVAERLGWSRLG